MHRIRKAMEKRDALYGLEGMIEFDKGYSEKVVSDDLLLKLGRGSQRQSNLAVFAESLRIENTKSGKKADHVRQYKIKVLGPHKKTDINTLVNIVLDDKCIVFSDKSTSYVEIEDYVEIHLRRNQISIPLKQP